MPGFVDNRRKHTIRTQWNTPILNHLYHLTQRKYIYLGFPGPEAIDIKLWREMIESVIAFELEIHGRNPRANIIRLSENLELLNIPFNVYEGYMENVVIYGEDREGNEFNPNDFITLFNLDFTNPITGTIPIGGRRRCLRYEALNRIIDFQRQLYITSGVDKFVIFITCRQDFHTQPVLNALNNFELLPATREYLDNYGLNDLIDGPRTKTDAKILNAFIFTWLRSVLQSHRTRSLFFPPIIYRGTGRRDHMMHFAVLCQMEEIDIPLVQDTLTAGEYFRLKFLEANDDTIAVTGADYPGDRPEPDPIQFLLKYEIVE